VVVQYLNTDFGPAGVARFSALDPISTHKPTNPGLGFPSQPTSCPPLREGSGGEGCRVFPNSVAHKMGEGMSDPKRKPGSESPPAVGGPPAHA